MPIQTNLFKYAALLLVLCLLFLPLPGNSLWWREVFNSGHVALFVFLAFFIYGQLKATPRLLNSLVIYPVVLIVGISLGGLIELLQSFVQRDASINDLYSDFFGLLAGLSLIAAYSLKKHQYKKVATALLLVSVIFVSIGVLPLIQLSWFYAERQRAFPVIVDFDADWSFRFMRFDKVDLLERTRRSQSKAVYPVQFNLGKYPGISVIEPEPDWSDYRSLRMKIFSKNKGDFILVLRIHDDKHNQQFLDRFNMRLQIRQGMNEIDVPLKRVELAPRGRKMDLANIAGIILFMREPDEPVRLEMSNIYLE